MIIVKREGVILESTLLEFENEGVMNPAVIAEGNTVHMFYRAVKKVITLPLVTVALTAP